MSLQSEPTNCCPFISNVTPIPMAAAPSPVIAGPNGKQIVNLLSPITCIGEQCTFWNNGQCVIKTACIHLAAVSEALNKSETT